jgi:hypothetical protein
VEALAVQKALAEAWRDADARTHAHVTKTIEEAVGFVRALSGEEASEDEGGAEGEGEGEGEDEGTNVHVLVTGIAPPCWRLAGGPRSQPSSSSQGCPSPFLYLSRVGRGY